MKTSTVSVLAAIAVALFAYIILVERHQLTDIELAGRGSRLIERFSQRRVESVVIEREGERIELVARNRPGDDDAEEERAWDLRSPLEARADTEAVAALLGALEWAEPRRRVEGIEPGELAGYGLVDPAVRVTLRIAGETVTLSIGQPDATEAGRYAMLDDQSVLYVVGDDVFEAADHDAVHFRNRELFPDLMLEMNEITLRAGDAVTRVEKDAEASDETWYLREPIAMMASAQRVRDIKRAISSLRATRFADAGEQLGDAYLRFESQAKVSDDAPYAPVTLVVGAACGEHEGQRYARAGEDGPLVCVNERDLAPLLRSASELRELRPITLPDTDIEAIDLVAGADSLHIEDEDGEWSYRLVRGGAAPVTGEVDPDAFSEWLSGIRSLETIEAESVDEAELGRRGLSAPRVTLTMHGRGSAPDHTLAMGGSDMRGVFLRRDEELVALVVPTDVEQQLAVSVVHFLPRRLLRERAEALVQVATTGAIAQTLERDGDGDFELSAPVVAPADGAAARDLARRLATLEAARFVAEAPAPEHGLATPRLTARFRFEGALEDDQDDADEDAHGEHDGHDHGETPSGPSAPPRTHVLKLGADTEGGAFAQLDERREVFVLPGAVVELLLRALVSNDLLRTSRVDLEGVRLEQEGVTIDVTHDGAFFVARGQRIPEERFEPVLMALERMRAESGRYGVSFDPALTVGVTRDERANAPQRYTLRVGPAGATHTDVQRADLNVTFRVPNDQVAPLRDFQP
ncbi:MAG: DUF4340 domain-containing protein [Sandaracinaceae bacterium]|nr:DUF4340 domain-containing protein [Myxococcales bacterium]MCB9660906.1 DUF4340 domain-containing protein [Sandaracinaceae bacterium]